MPKAQQINDLPAWAQGIVVVIFIAMLALVLNAVGEATGHNIFTEQAEEAIRTIQFGLQIADTMKETLAIFAIIFVVVVYVLKELC